jgi:hypothetical protein
VGDPATVVVVVVDVGDAATVVVDDDDVGDMAKPLSLSSTTWVTRGKPLSSSSTTWVTRQSRCRRRRRHG